MDLRNTDAGACDEFRAMLVDLSDRVDECGLEMMKFYCKPHVTRMRLEVILNAINLWEALEERGLLSSNNTSFLRELFEKAVKRNDLLKIVVDYDQRTRNRPAQSTAVSTLDIGSQFWCFNQLCFFQCYSSVRQKVAAVKWNIYPKIEICERVCRKNAPNLT